MTTKGVILEQAKPSSTHVDPDGGGANPRLAPETEAEQTLWEKSSPWVHGVLGVASFVPGLSVVTGAVDAAIYAAEGETVEAGIAVASMIPGGKVVTTVGKAAKGAVSLVKGTGTAARIAKGAHAAGDVVNSTRQADEVARVAGEAKTLNDASKIHEGRDAVELGAVVRKRKKEVTVKRREHKVPCFHPFDKKKFMAMSKGDQKAYLKEMANQLKRQEDVINSLSASEFKAARDAFAAANRNPAANAAQARIREHITADIKRSIFSTLTEKRGIALREADSMAATKADEIMSKLAALHDPDMVAGGWMTPDPSKLGRADVNSSIGGSWNQNDRISGMDRYAADTINENRGDQKMNVKLEPCRGRGMR